MKVSSENTIVLRVLNWVKWIGYIFIALLAFYILWALFLRHIHLPFLVIDGSPQQQVLAALTGSIFGALLGSVATTLGILITDRVRENRNREHTRRVMHYNSLIKLQRQTNVLRATLEDNLQAIDSIINADKVGLPTFQRPIEAITDESHFENLYDLILINMLNDLYYDIRRLNLDCSNLNRALDKLAEEFFSSRITKEQYNTEVGIFMPKVVELRKFIEGLLDKQIMDVIAYVRICADKDASSSIQKQYAKLQKGRAKISSNDIQKTRKEIEKELNEQASSSSSSHKVG